MTQQTISLGGEGGQSFAFSPIGASVTGKIIGGEEVQQSDIKTGDPSFWPDGRPKMMTRLTLQTQLRDSSDDDGIRSVYLRGSVKSESKSIMAAVRDAAKAATGTYEIAIGGTITITYTGDGVKTHPAYDAPKQYEARYVAPTVSLGEPAQQQPTNGVAAAQAQAQQPQHDQQPASFIGWLNGKPIDAALLAAFENSGTDPRTLPGFVPAQ